MSIPIGTYLSKVQYCESQGKLPLHPFENSLEPFHFASLKYHVESEGEEFMFFQVSTYPEMKRICGSFHGMFLQFQKLLGEDPIHLESQGFRATFHLNKTWNSLLILLTPYKFPLSFLYNTLRRISFTISNLFLKPSFKSAKFVKNCLIYFSKSMNTLEGFQAVLASYKVPEMKGKPQLLETDTILTDIGAPQLISNAIDDSIIMQSLSLFVYNRVLFTSMNDSDLCISELIVSNQQNTTEEFLTLDNKVFCIAKHYNTTMVSICEPKGGLERCCKMQVALMKLDSKGIINKMQSCFAKILPPQQALDTVILSGPFMVSQPPFIGSPLFVNKDINLEAKSIAALMYESLSKPARRAVVDFLIENTEFKVRYYRNGDALIFLISLIKEKIDENEISSLPHLLKSVKYIP